MSITQRALFDQCYVRTNLVSIEYRIRRPFCPSFLSFIDPCNRLQKRWLRAQKSGEPCLLCDDAPHHRRPVHELPHLPTVDGRAMSCATSPPSLAGPRPYPTSPPSLARPRPLHTSPPSPVGPHPLPRPHLLLHPRGSNGMNSGGAARSCTRWGGRRGPA
jgi:hypothetical protein